MLPQKALNALIDIRTSLLSRELVSQEQPLQTTESVGERELAERKPLERDSPRNGSRMRHARARALPWQRFCQRGHW